MEGLYIHIPFCIRKCTYCDFYSVPSPELYDEFLKALEYELSYKMSRYKDFCPSTIFVGGGTPTVLNSVQLHFLSDILHRYIDFGNVKEFTFESNPGTITEDKLNAMSECGCNRLSIGLQSTEDKITRTLGRIHSYKDFLESYFLARKCGYTNINIDLMFGLPYQTINSFKETVCTVMDLRPQHISAYSLTVDENTPIHGQILRGEITLPDEDTERDMYHMLRKLLLSEKYYQYEISNWSEEGRQCRHNIIYWSGENYIGLGPGAHSLYNGTRFYNNPDICEYIQRAKSHNDNANEYTVLSDRDKISEYMITRLRMNCGISKKEFSRRFSENIDLLFKSEISDGISRGLLVSDDKNLYLTEKGFDLGDIVFVSFV